MKQLEEYWPTSTWRSTEPKTFNMQLEDFALLRQFAQEDDRVHSLLLIRSGYIIFEEYYHGWSQNHYHNINSITKNITSALVGIAVREKMIDNLERSIFSFFPEYAYLGEQEQRNTVLLHHLLSLTSGFMLKGDIDIFLEHSATLESILSRPLVHTPGTTFSYDDIDIHLISLILARITGMSMVNFAQTYLFEPLGIWRNEQGQLYPWKDGTASKDDPHPWGLWNEQNDQLWSIDRQGNPIGAFGLQLTTREMAKLGYLYLHQGIWDGKQIIPTEYIQASLRAYSSTSKGTDYGYCWYLARFEEQNSFWAIGFGGQVITCFPDLDLIFAMTSHPVVGRPAAHNRVMNEGLKPIIKKMQPKGFQPLDHKSMS